MGFALITYKNLIEIINLNNENNERFTKRSN